MYFQQLAILSAADEEGVAISSTKNASFPPASSAEQLSSAPSAASEEVVAISLTKDASFPPASFAEQLSSAPSAAGKEGKASIPREGQKVIENNENLPTMFNSLMEHEENQHFKNKLPYKEVQVLF